MVHFIKKCVVSADLMAAMCEIIASCHFQPHLFIRGKSGHPWIEQCVIFSSCGLGLCGNNFQALTLLHH